jgi:hypothetical protein
VGRETIAVVYWRGQSAQTRVLLEASELILRGGIKERIARSAIANVRRTEHGVAFTASGAPLSIEMTAKQANLWLKALTAPPPSLASKLDIGPEKPAYILGTVDDAALVKALAGATTEKMVAATTIVAVLSSPHDLDAALDVARTRSALPLWCVYGKGPRASIGEGAVRSYLRSNGYIDTKVAAISPHLTATRYCAKRV